MTDSEIHLKSIEYLLNLKCWEWNDLKDVPEELSVKVFNLIELNTLMPDYRLTWCEVTSLKEETLFMKSIPGEFKMGENESRCYNTESNEVNLPTDGGIISETI